MHDASPTPSSRGPAIGPISDSQHIWQSANPSQDSSPEVQRDEFSTQVRLVESSEGFPLLEIDLLTLTGEGVGPTATLFRGLDELSKPVSIKTFEHEGAAGFGILGSSSVSA